MKKKLIASDIFRIGITAVIKAFIDKTRITVG